MRVLISISKCDTPDFGAPRKRARDIRQALCLEHNQESGAVGQCDLVMGLSSSRLLAGGVRSLFVCIAL